LSGVSSRSLERVRAVAKCGDCGNTALGVTRIEYRPWEAEPKRLHICDGCRRQIVQRSLQLVLADLVASF
jgi:hypothetical protein